MHRSPADKPAIIARLCDVQAGCYGGVFSSATGARLTTERASPSAADRRHGGNRRLNASPQGDAQEAHCRQSTAGQRHRRFCATVCKTVRPMLSYRCLSCLSVTLVYCGQTAGWIMMKLGMQVGFGSSHIVLDGDPAPLPQKG